MDKPTNGDNSGDVEAIFAEFVREAEKVSPSIPVAPVAPSRYNGPPKLVLIQGGKK